MVEQYRLHYTGAFNGKIDAQALRDYMVKDFEPSEAMAFGSAFHEMLEHGPEQYKVGEGSYHVPIGYWPDGIDLGTIHAQAAQGYRAAHPYMNYEVPGITYLEGINGYDIQCRYKIDGVQGVTIYEQKTTRSSWKKTYEEYRDSLQWQLYLLANPDIDCVTYNVFQFKHYKRSGKTVFVPHEFHYFRYPGMEGNVRSYLNGFIDFITHWGLVERVTV